MHWYSGEQGNSASNDIEIWHSLIPVGIRNLENGFIHEVCCYFIQTSDNMEKKLKAGSEPIRTYLGVHHPYNIPVRASVQVTAEAKIYSAVAVFHTHRSHLGVSEIAKKEH